MPPGPHSKKLTNSDTRRTAVSLNKYCICQETTGIKYRYQVSLFHLTLIYSEAILMLFAYNFIFNPILHLTQIHSEAFFFSFLSSTLALLLYGYFYLSTYPTCFT